VGAVVLVGAVGHVMWWFIGGIPEEVHPKYFIANVAFYLSLIELLGFTLLGLLLWSVWQDDQEESKFVSILSLLFYSLIVLVFLAFSGHPLGMTIFVFGYMLLGG
jgi:hypothetical protein